jgi:hypothetical protein
VSLKGSNVDINEITMMMEALNLENRAEGSKTLLTGNFAATSFLVNEAPENNFNQDLPVEKTESDACSLILTKNLMSRGPRLIMDHGLISNLLPALGLVDQQAFAHFLSRAYNVTVPWNTPPVQLPIDSPCDFPNLKIPSEGHVCKRLEATIDGEKGEFFGIVCKSSGIPDGYGVFRTSDWVHCGQVKNDVYQQGRKVSVNASEELLRLTNRKWLANGTVLEKIELFSRQGVTRDFLKDGQKIDTINPRLNLRNDA